MKAQLSMEAIYAVTAVMMIFILAMALKLNLQEEMTDRMIYLCAEDECTRLSRSINTVYATGAGAAMETEIGENVSVSQGLLEMASGHNTHYCTIDKNAVSDAITLRPGRHTIKNRGGHVEIT
jgi:hypothetical protein